MSHMMCLCGEVIVTGLIPNPERFTVISDLLSETILEKLVQQHQVSISEADLNRDITRILSHLGTPGVLDAYECKHCGRLAVFARASDVKTLFWFQLEKVEFPDKAQSLTDATDKLQSGEFPVNWQKDLYK